MTVINNLRNVLKTNMFCGMWIIYVKISIYVHLLNLVRIRNFLIKLTFIQ